MADSPFSTMIAISKGREKNPESIKGIEVLVLKAIGFIDTNIGVNLSKYSYTIDPEIYRGLLFLEFQNLHKMPSWIKKQKKEKDDLLTNLIQDYWKKYSLDKRDLIENKQVIRVIVENDLQNFLHELGTDEKTFQKLNVELKPTCDDKNTLEKWI